LSYGACLLIPGLMHVLAFGEQAIELSSGRIARSLPHTSKYSPVLEALTGALSDSILLGGVVLAVILVARHYFKRPSHLAAAICIVVLTTVATGADAWGEFSAQAIRLLLLCCVAYTGVRFVWRCNLLAYIMTIFLLSLTSDARAIMSASPDAYLDAGVLILVLAATPLAAWSYLWYRGSRED